MASKFFRIQSLGRGLAIVRIAVGLYFANEAVRKVSAGWLISGSDLIRTVQAYPAARSGGVYHSFVTETVLPHATVFALLVTLGECTVAVSLILGLLTRAGALIALWLNLNFMLLKGVTNPSANIDRLFIVINIVLILTAAGRVWGLDSRFRNNLALFPIFAWLAGARVPFSRQQRSTESNSAEAQLVPPREESS